MALTKVTYSMIKGAQSCVFDYMTPAEIQAVQTNTWTEFTNVSTACQAAMDANGSVYFPPGVYRLSSPLLLRTPKQCIYGAGQGVTEFQPTDVFSSATVGGQTRAFLVWYQPTAGTWNVNTDWIIGGTISDLTLNCRELCDGILFNRVNQSQLVINVHIYRPFNGIDNYLGWRHTYENVYIQGAEIISIKLGPGCNGTSVVGCYLRGWDSISRTQVHLDIDSGSIGNSCTGGAIEACDTGVRTQGKGTVAVSGVDFEDCFYRFVNCFGLYSGITLVEAGGASTVSGCGFVGVPSGGGLVSAGASISSTGNTFINGGAIPSGADEYALWGLEAGQNPVGMLGTGVSSQNDVFFGWGDQLTGRVRRGFVNTIVLGTLNAEDVRVPLGTWTPVLTGITTTGVVTIQDARFVKMGNLVTFNVQIQATTISTTAGPSTITGLPFTPSIAGAASVITGSITNPSAALVYPSGTGVIYLPENAAWGNSLIITGTYFTL